jgi:hypothetical protein
VATVIFKLRANQVPLKIPLTGAASTGFAAVAISTERLMLSGSVRRSYLYLQWHASNLPPSVIFISHLYLEAVPTRLRNR